MTAGVAIVRLRAEHWPAVARIYAEGIATGDATFETAVPAWDEWDRSHLADHRLLAQAGDEALGWAALTPVSGRCVYGGVAEGSVYAGEEARGRGIGAALLDALVASSETGGLWTLQAGIFPENAASLRLHERAGFRVVGLRERLGRRDGVWRDVVLVERRSPVVA